MNEERLIAGSAESRAAPRALAVIDLLRSLLRNTLGINQAKFAENLQPGFTDLVFFDHHKPDQAVIPRYKSVRVAPVRIPIER